MNVPSLRAVPAVMLLLVRFFSLPLCAATHTWKGGGGDNYWSNEDNWTGGAPDDDEGSFIELIFPATAQSYHTICDLSYFDVERMIFRGNYTVSHTDNGDDNSFGIPDGNLNGIIMDSATPRTVIFDGSTRFSALAPITLTSGTLKFQGSVGLFRKISGTGDVFYEGFGGLSGTCDVSGVTMHLKGGAIGMALSKIIVSDGATLSVETNYQINGAALNVYNATATLASGVLDNAGALWVTNNGLVNVLNVGAALQLSDTVTCGNGSNYMLGHFLLGGKTREFYVPNIADTLTVSGVLDDGAGLNGVNVVTTGGIKKTGPGPFRLGSTGTFHGPVIVSEGDLQVSNGAAFGTAGGNVTVDAGAQLTLKGISVSGETLTLGGKLSLPTGTNAWTGNIVLQSTAEAIEMKPAPEVCYFKHSGIMSGPGTLRLESAGTLELAGAGSNTFTGETILRSGVIRLNKSSGNAIPGPLTIDPYLPVEDTRVVLDADNQIADSATILMDGYEALLDLSSHNETIGALLAFNLNAGEVRMGNSRMGTATFTTGANNLSTEYTGKITGADGMTLAKTGTGKFTMTAGWINTYSGQTRVLGGTLEVGYAQGIEDVLVKTGGTLSGLGKTGTVTLDGGNLATSHLNTKSVVANPAGGKYLADLLGAAPVPGGYDQLKVTGIVNLTNTTLLAGLGFTPVSGAKFVIVQNDGTDAVTGQFTGLAEGANLNIGGKPFSISYHGGDGNDVELKFIGTGGKPRILTVGYNRVQDKIHLEALGPPGVLCYWQVSGSLGLWSNFASGMPDAAGLLKLDQSIGLHADRLFFRLVQP